MTPVTREEVEVMLREHGQEIEQRVMENSSRARYEAITAAMSEPMSLIPDIDLMKKEVIQLRERLESTVTKEGQKDILMMYQTTNETKNEYDPRMVKLEVQYANLVEEILTLQKLAEETEKKISDSKATIGKERDEIRVDWSARVTQLKESQTEADSYISELRRRIPALEISVVAVEEKITEANRQVAELQQRRAEGQEVSGPPGMGRARRTQ